MFDATDSAPASDDDAAERAAVGKPPSDDVSELAYCDVRMLPNTATPSAPPSSRVVSFIAEPTPARSRGTPDMIALVNGAIATDIPATITTIGNTSMA